MKTFIASTIVALTLVASVAGPATAGDFNPSTFFQQLINDSQ